MNSRNKGTGATLGEVVGIIGLIASCIGIYAFFSGNESIEEIFDDSATPISIVDVQDVQSTVEADEDLSLTATPTYPQEETNSPWEHVGLTGESISTIATGNNGIVYVGTDNYEHGVFKSLDNGDKWTAINNGLDDLDVEYILVAPDNPDNVIAEGAGYVTTDSYSSDGGKTWRIIYQPKYFEYAITAFATRDGREIFLTVSSNFIDLYRSTDAGSSWHPIGESRYVGCSSIFVVYGTNTLYCIEHDGRGRGSRIGRVHRSNNGGVTWQSGASVGREYPLSSFAIAESEPDTVYVGTTGNGIWKSVDGGGSWFPLNNTLPRQGNDVGILSIAVNPINPNHVFVAIENEGIFQSKDGGESWSQIGNLMNARAIELSVSNPMYLFAGTDEDGIWRLNISE